MAPGAEMLLRLPEGAASIEPASDEVLVEPCQIREIAGTGTFSVVIANLSEANSAAYALFAEGPAQAGPIEPLGAVFADVKTDGNRVYIVNQSPQTAPANIQAKALST